MDRLDALEAQSIYIFGEEFAPLKKLALLGSLGKYGSVSRDTRNSRSESEHQHLKSSRFVGMKSGPLVKSMKRLERVKRANGAGDALRSRPFQ